MIFIFSKYWFFFYFFFLLFLLYFSSHLFDCCSIIRSILSRHLQFDEHEINSSIPEHTHSIIKIQPFSISIQQQDQISGKQKKKKLHWPSINYISFCINYHLNMPYFICRVFIHVCFFLCVFCFISLRHLDVNF
jgi:hypothetical protein